MTTEIEALQRDTTTIHARPPGGTRAAEPPTDVSITFSGTTLPGRVRVPSDARALVMMVGTSAGARLDPRNNATADVLHRAGLATALVDLVLPGESPTAPKGPGELFFVNRLIAVTDRIRTGSGLEEMPVGYLGTGIGAAAALWTASLLRSEIGSVVAIDWLPAGAEPYLAFIEAPTLLIVAERDHQLLDLNARALARLRHESRLEVTYEALPGRTDAGSPVDEISLTRAWFLRHLSDRPPAPPSWVTRWDGHARPASATSR